MYLSHFTDFSYNFLHAISQITFCAFAIRILQITITPTSVPGTLQLSSVCYTNVCIITIFIIGLLLSTMWPNY